MRTAVAGGEEEPRPTGPAFIGNTSGSVNWGSVYVTVSGPGDYFTQNVRVRSYRPSPPPPGPDAVPAPEPFPDGPLRWEAIRLDTQPLPAPEA